MRCCSAFRPNRRAQPRGGNGKSGGGRELEWVAESKFVGWLDLSQKHDVTVTVMKILEDGEINSTEVIF